MKWKDITAGLLGALHFSWPSRSFFSLLLLLGTINALFRIDKEVPVDA